jgi:hypothetical protein
MRDSSMHRAIIALSVTFCEESISTLPYRLALNLPPTRTGWHV